VFGVLPQAGGEGGDGAAESKEAEILDTLARFRQQVPCPLSGGPSSPASFLSLSLRVVSPGQRVRGPQVRKTAISSANVKKDVLSLCDQLRDKDLPAVGFRLEVSPRFISPVFDLSLSCARRSSMSLHTTNRTTRRPRACGRERPEAGPNKRITLWAHSSADLSAVARSPPPTRATCRPFLAAVPGLPTSRVPLPASAPCDVDLRHRYPRLSSLSLVAVYLWAVLPLLQKPGDRTPVPAVVLGYAHLLWCREGSGGEIPHPRSDHGACIRYSLWTGTRGTSPSFFRPRFCE
jgi:hypothetical protein